MHATERASKKVRPDVGHMFKVRRRKEQSERHTHTPAEVRFGPVLGGVTSLSRRGYNNATYAAEVEPSPPKQRVLFS